MSGDGAELLFDVLTPIGLHVHVTRAYWELIVQVKHPAMAGREAYIQEVLRNPDTIRRSKSDPNVYMFYKSERIRRWACAVVKGLDGAAFLITAYPTDAIKEGVEIWHR
jgi:hypothetical protein